MDPELSYRITEGNVIRSGRMKEVITNETREQMSEHVIEKRDTEN
jgi:hypothetical protein